MPLKLSPTQIAFNARGDGSFKQPFAEQINFFRQKLNLPTERYDDILKSAHDRAFVVAGAMKADLLNDLRGAVDAAISDGESIGAFRARFESIVRANGWEGWTGSDTQPGRDWRTRVIYTTNMRTSYAAGRYQQLKDPELLAKWPYWKYVHNDTVETPRELHVSWSGLVLRHDDPWWDEHYPPNGFGCRCRVTSARNNEYKGQIPKGKGETYEKVDRNGEIHVLPKGVDYGWDYAPGASLDRSIDSFIDNKVTSLPAELGQAFKNDAEADNLRFTPAKTVKEAEQYAVSNDLVDYASYSGINVEVANAFNQSLFEHIKEFPELRKNQEFIGTIQAQFAKHRQNEIEKTLILLKQKNPSISEERLRSHAEKMIKLIKTDNRSAQSWAQPGVKGLAVNKKWGSNLDRYKEALLYSEEVRHHPDGCGIIKADADHEFGHQLDNLLNLKSDPEIVDMYQKFKLAGDKYQLSDYALSEIDEFIAEGWAEFRNNKYLGELSEKIGNIVLDRYRKFKNG